MAARCVSDTKDWEARKREYDVGNEPNDIFAARYENSYLDLKPAPALPELRCISEFEIRGIAGPIARYRHFAPRAVCFMASKMSGLKTADWSLHDHERRDVERRKKLRADFADSLQTLPSTLRWFRLTYYGDEPKDHSFVFPSILDVANQSNSDTLSLALHKLSQRLTHCHLDAEVGPEVFWPSNDDGTCSPPLWPSLLQYSISPGAIAPSGKWRFRRRTDTSDSDSESDIDSDWGEHDHYFHDEPDPDNVPPLLLAAARAASRMPALLSLNFILNSPIARGGVEVEYNVPRGGRPTSAGTPPGMAELVVESGSTFQHGDQVMEAWSEAARGHTGTESGLALVTKEMNWRY